MAREIGDPEILANADINLAANHHALGDLERARRHLEPIEATLARPGDPWMRWRYALHVLNARGRIELTRAAPERALACADNELAGARKHRAPKIEVRALTLRGTALLAIDQRAEADAAFRTGLAIAEQLGYRRGVWQLHSLLAQTARRNGETGAAAMHVGQAQTIAESVARSLTNADLRRCLVQSVNVVASAADSAA